MKTTKLMIMAAFAFAVVLIGQAAYSSEMVCNARYDIGQKWLATGTVTKTEGTTFYLLGRDNEVYKINAAESQVYVDEERVNKEAWAVGDTVRVYGEVSNPCVISAERIRIFKRDDASTAQVKAAPEKEVSIVIEKEPTAPAYYGAGTAAVTEQPKGQACGWTGLVTNVKYGSRAVDIQTSQGSYSVVIGDSPILRGNRRITLGLINIGDTVDVTGTYSGPGEINAQQVEVTRTVADAQNSLPTTPLSIVGVIMNIDYASRTFRMQTDSGEMVVLVGPEAFIQHNHERWLFTELKPGQRIKMSGYGSLASGYAAQHIMVISV